VIYDTEPWRADGQVLALRFLPNGDIQAFAAPPQQRMRRTAWWIERRLRSDAPVTVQDQLEDTPFYQRAVVQSELLGERVTSFHETLYVPRLRSSVVQAMLPWRMPRRS
jgi:carotenoid 1,2-hydratase